MKLLSNNDSLTREEYLKECSLSSLKPEDVFTSASITAAYLNSCEVSEVRLVGSDGFKRELEQAGIKVEGGSDHSPFEDVPLDIDLFNNYPANEGVQAVVVGTDPGFTYSKMCLASLYV
mmetsp:Transcript_6658/g.10704  ORF Transcript_6658/g.10704 Transcript_6658/m.10704 type:complete len:119 (-) Transcript_6658:357-713(-)|eukprot:CAMPEP_0170484852 /NCGR_PEP_ID=MMETSP0208-20121228/4229_1 /TAXON_ID=197538 /ORGANISM="Strombidium inclinatum, Strain S3" /LENGTH=118 /DNA_ID=CAMNT_0010758301 /DNA_START=128 /DNA_END=484 /DNA_ORIENTATION=-